MKTCTACTDPRHGASKYCRWHYKDALKTLRQSGYLTPRPKRAYRPPDAREVTRETKFGKAQ